MDKSNRKTMIVGPKVFVKARPKAIHYRPQKKSIGQKKRSTAVLQPLLTLNLRL